MDGRGRFLDNIFIERLWRSMKYEAVYLHELVDGIEARRLIDGWLALYNEERPHGARRQGACRSLPRADRNSTESRVFHSPGDGGCGVINPWSTP